HEVLPPDRAELRELLAVPGADRPPGGGAGKVTPLVSSLRQPGLRPQTSEVSEDFGSLARPAHANIFLISSISLSIPSWCRRSFAGESMPRPILMPCLRNGTSQGERFASRSSVPRNLSTATPAASAAMRSRLARTTLPSAVSPCEGPPKTNDC